MELFSHRTNIDFMKYRGFFLTGSLALIVLSFVVWFQAGTGKYGVDFSGGIELVAQFAERVDIAKVRAVVEEKGFRNVVVQAFGSGGNEFSLRLKSEEKAETTQQLLTALQTLGSVTPLKEDFIGPVIGKEVREAGLKAFILALVSILIYVGFRFELRFAIGGVAALFHDVIVSAGIYVLSGREVDAAMLAAILTIVGFSINDTIVIFDRIREHMLKAQKKGGVKSKAQLAELMNLSLNETLSRTLLTSLTVWFVVSVLLWFGGGAVENLAFVLFVGIISGTYSTIYIANPIVLLCHREKK